MSWARNHRVRRRFFSVRLNVRMLFVSFQIEAAKKIDGFKIFSSAELIWNPLALLARIVQIKHRSNRVYPKAIGMIFIQPEHGARHQEAAYFTSAVIKNQRLPVRMKPLPRVRVLKQVRAVEESKAVTIRREVRRNPVQN